MAGEVSVRLPPGEPSEDGPQGGAAPNLRADQAAQETRVPRLELSPLCGLGDLSEGRVAPGAQDLPRGQPGQGSPPRRAAPSILAPRRKSETSMGRFPAG